MSEPRKCPHCSKPMERTTGVLSLVLADGGTLTIDSVPVWRCDCAVTGSPILGFDGGLFVSAPTGPLQ